MQDGSPKRTKRHQNGPTGGGNSAGPVSQKGVYRWGKPKNKRSRNLGGNVLYTGGKHNSHSLTQVAGTSDTTPVHQYVAPGVSAQPPWRERPSLVPRSGGSFHRSIPPQAVQTRLSRRSPAKSARVRLVPLPALAGRWRLEANSSARTPPTRSVTAAQPVARAILIREGGGRWLRPGYTPFQIGYVRAQGHLFSLVKIK